VELEDLSWWPRAVRDGGTDWLAFMWNTSQVFSACAPRIRGAMNATGTTRVLDLCSGSGGPWPTLQPALAVSGPADVLLSDRFPHADAVAAAAARRLRYHPLPVDATAVPPEFDGVRTMFNAFHHFPPPVARAILADAVARRRAVAVFEGVDRRVIGLVAMPLQLPAMLLCTPFVRPMRVSRLLFTYVVPLIPLMVLFDGTVSFLRLYLERDLRELVATVPGAESYDWDIGTTVADRLPVAMTHLVGVPKPE
jgi:hypothetical protein